MLDPSTMASMVVKTFVLIFLIFTHSHLGTSLLYFSDVLLTSELLIWNKWKIIRELNLRFSIRYYVKSLSNRAYIAHISSNIVLGYIDYNLNLNANGWCSIVGGAHGLSLKEGLKEEPNPCGQVNKYIYQKHFYVANLIIAQPDQEVRTSPPT